MELTDTPQKLQQRLSDLYAANWALTALALASERGLLAALSPESAVSTARLAATTGLSSDLTAALLDVLAAQGMVASDAAGHRSSPALASMLASPAAGMLRADLRSTLGVQRDLVAAARDPAAPLEGWRTADAVVVDAQATASRLITEMISRDVFPRFMPDLAAQLAAPGARLLDVGAGAAGACVGFCACFPAIRVVGIEPAELPRQLAAARIAAAGLVERIEMRAGGIEDVGEESAFDAAYVAQMFIPEAPLRAGLPVVLRALKPGGTLFTVATAIAGPELPAAVSRLRSTVWGGGPRLAASVTAMLQEAGFVEVVTVPMPGGPMTSITARRAPEA